MKILFESDFDKIYEELSQLVEGNFEYKAKQISRYIIPQNVRDDCHSDFVRTELPEVEWLPLTRSLYNTLDGWIKNKRLSGIYVVKNDVTNQLYFGKAAKFADRINAHDRADFDDSKFLHAAINYAKIHTDELYEVNGNLVPITFSWGIYKITDDLATAEKEAISQWNTYESPYDYNSTPGGEGQGVITRNFDEVVEYVKVLLSDTNLETAKSQRDIAAAVCAKFGFDSYDPNLVRDINTKYGIRDQAIIDAIAKRDQKAKKNEQNHIATLYRDGQFIGNFESVGAAERAVFEILTKEKAVTRAGKPVTFKDIEAKLSKKSSRKYKGFTIVVDED